MKRFWILVSILLLATCGGGGGSPTEPKEPAPVANFTATPTTLIQGQAVTFTSTSTGTITSYAWNVDDDPAIEGTTATYEHTYTEVGTYSVTLTVTGPRGSNPKTVADMITVSTAAPTPTTATSQTVQEDGSTTISLTATDPNGQAVTFAITTDPTNGTATLSGTEITYTPNANFYGTDSFAYTASNGTYTSDPVTITITVEGQDDEPTTNDVSVTTDEDTAVTVNLDATEIDGDNYSFNIVSQPTNGTLGSVNGNQVEYTPNQDFNGTDTFTFEATDDRTFRRNVATATITVNPVNDAPVANDVTASMDENKEFTRLMPVTITLDATDVEGDDLTYSIVGTPSNGTLGSISDNQIIYTPSQDWNGEDTFTYKANDGTDDSNTATVTVTVTSVNDAPVTEDQSASTDEDTAVEITLTATDVENDNLTFTIVSDVSNGTTALSGTTVTYTPTANFNGTDTFTFKANDGTDDSNVSTVTITVASVNDAPVANDVTASTQSRTGNMRQAVSITLDATDVEGDDLTYSLVSDVSNGTTSLSGNIVTYTPTANYDGTDTFTYKANDGTDDSNTATGTITVADINQAPIANDMSFSLDRESSIDFTLDATDLDGDNLSKSIITQPNNGVLLSGIGLSMTYSPNINYNDTNSYPITDSFIYLVNDGDRNSIPGTVTFQINEGGKFFPHAYGWEEDYRFLGIVKNNAGEMIASYKENDEGAFKIFVFDDDLNVVSWYEARDNVDEATYISPIYSYSKYSDGFIFKNHPRQIWFMDDDLIFYDNKYLQTSYQPNPPTVSGVYLDDANIIEISNGKYLMGGRFQPSTSSDLVDPALFYLDSDLNVESHINLSFLEVGLGYELVMPRYVIMLNDGNIFANINGPNWQTIVCKMDLDGNIIWYYDYGMQNGFGSGGTGEIIEDSNNNIIILQGNHILARDQNGNELFHIQREISFKRIIEHSAGGYVIGGSKYDRPFLMYLDSSGNVIWERQYDLPRTISQNYAQMIINILESSDGNIISAYNYDNAVNINTGGIIKVDINDGTKLLP